jgi:vancomycin resistance protein YoaR
MTATGLFYWQAYGSKRSFLPGVSIANTAVAGLNQSQAAALLEKNIKQAYLQPVLFTSGTYRHQTTLGELAFPVETARVVNEVYLQESQRGWVSKTTSMAGRKTMEYSIPIEYRSQVVEQLLKDWQAALGTPAVDAYLEMDRVQGLVVIPEKVGKEVDYDATWVQMPKAWNTAPIIEIAVIMKEKPPAVLAKDLEGMGELSSYATWYKVADADRTHNLAKASNIINGAVVKPGQVFSFNQTVGPRTGVTGFRDALVIVGDRFEPGTGGGICQVSSTLYNATLLAGLEIVERNNHGLLVAYIPPGLDATVAYGLQDFRFKNNTGSPVYIRSIAAGGKLTITIYGNLAYKKNVKLSYVIDQVIPFQEIRELKPDMAPGSEKVDHNGAPGYVVRSFRSYLNTNGETVASEQLSRDLYKPLNKLVFVGPAAPAGDPGQQDVKPADNPLKPDDKPETVDKPETSKPGDVDPGSEGYTD